MIGIDHLYGAVTIPEWLHPVLLSPEVQRLRDVRLINTSSPSCAALSDVRRFTHTLGVFHLASQISAKITARYGSEATRNFLAAVLIHDIGTPAFGHLFEYQLAAVKGWHHEHFVTDIIRGTYRPEKRYQQVYYNNSLRLHEALDRLGLDVEAITAYIHGDGSLGQLLAGTLDVDNVDNVYRMAVHLGLNPDVREPVRLMESTSLENDGPIFSAECLEIIQSWSYWRRKCYEVLAFDEMCLSGQAMLTDAITAALEDEKLGEQHWFYTDHQLIARLLDCENSKDAVQRFVIGDFYESLFLGWYGCSKGERDFRKPSERHVLSRALSKVMEMPCCPYVFYDAGTFSKRLSVRVRHNSVKLPFPTETGTCNYASGKAEEIGACEMLETLELGEQSQSTIVSVFTPRRLSPSERSRAFRLVAGTLEEFGLPAALLRTPPEKSDIYELPSQKKLPF